MATLSPTDIEQYLEQMHDVFDQQVGMDKKEWASLKHLFSPYEVPAKHTLQKAGDYAHTSHFILKGLVRFFYNTLDGKELNKGFYGENNIAGSLSAIVLNEPCRFAIETLEPSIVIDLPVETMSQLSGPGSCWEKLINHSCQMMLVRNERREAELLTMTAKQRFLQFARNFPDYLVRIPQYHIASYLGITPVALSKYKKQWLATPE